VERRWCLFTFAVQYAVKTGKFTYNCITTMNFLTNFTINKFCLCLIIQKSRLCCQNSDVYICKHACVFLVTVWRHTTLRPMLFLLFSWPLRTVWYIPTKNGLFRSPNFLYTASLLSFIIVLNWACIFLRICGWKDDISMLKVSNSIFYFICWFYCYFHDNA
jgi:hypothetical protein